MVLHQSRKLTLALDLHPRELNEHLTRDFPRARRHHLNSPPTTRPLAVARSRSTAAATTAIMPAAPVVPQAKDFAPMINWSYDLIIWSFSCEFNATDPGTLWDFVGRCQAGTGTGGLGLRLAMGMLRNGTGN